MLKTFSRIKEKQQATLFDPLVRPHIEHLYRLAYHFTGSQHTAEDLVQELLTKLFIKTSELMEIEKLRPWLTAALTNLFIDSRRQLLRSAISYTDDIQTLEETTFDHRHCPDHILEKEQEINQLQEIFNQLNEEHRLILTLHDIEGYSLPELENMLDIPLGTLKSRLFRARNRLQIILENPENEEPFSVANRVNQ